MKEGFGVDGDRDVLMMMVGTVWMALVMTLMRAMITVVVISKDDNDYQHHPIRSNQGGTNLLLPGV